MSRFTQHTALTASAGKADLLVAKFLEAAEIQRGNPSCELMLVSKSATDEDVVYLTEVWSSETAWDEARQSERITAWSADMPSLVNGPPVTLRLEVVGGKGLPPRS
jgi:quinol monooxygenase YgiN